MSVATQAPSAGGESRIVLDGVSWQLYEMLRDLPDSRNIRMTYDNGVLELMTRSRLHEWLVELIGRLIVEWTMAWGISLSSCGSLTMQREDLRKGCEPDKGFYIDHEVLMRGHDEFDPLIHPAPDLVVEVDITSPSLKRLPIYAAMRVPEVWRHDGQVLHFLELQGDRYVERDHSIRFPQLTPADLQRFLDLRNQMDENRLVSEFRQWIETTFPERG